MPRVIFLSIEPFSNQFVLWTRKYALFSIKDYTPSAHALGLGPYREAVSE
jgi:hypothetical protein